MTDKEFFIFCYTSVRLTLQPQKKTLTPFLVRGRRQNGRKISLCNALLCCWGSDDASMMKVDDLLCQLGVNEDGRCDNEPCRY